MKSFKSEINSFLINGTFDNNLDDVGNLNLNTDPIQVNEQYIGFALSNYLYNKEKIEQLYDVNITEFNVPNSIVTISSNDNFDKISQENEILKIQLNSLISSSNENNSSATLDAAKDIILGLRIKTGEGTSIDDFESTFPYLKK
jgi:hypothetical protein